MVINICDRFLSQCFSCRCVLKLLTDLLDDLTFYLIRKSPSLRFLKENKTFFDLCTIQLDEIRFLRKDVIENIYEKWIRNGSKYEFISSAHKIQQFLFPDNGQSRKTLQPGFQLIVQIPPDDEYVLVFDFIEI